MSNDPFPGIPLHTRNGPQPYGPSTISPRSDGIPTNTWGPTRTLQATPGGFAERQKPTGTRPSPEEQYHDIARETRNAVAARSEEIIAKFQAIARGEILPDEIPANGPAKPTSGQSGTIFESVSAGTKPDAEIPAVPGAIVTQDDQDLDGLIITP